MATNLALDDKLIREAVRLGNHKTKKEAVTAALEEYIKMQGRLRILELEGTIDFRDDWDYKAARQGKHGTSAVQSKLKGVRGGRRG